MRVQKTNWGGLSSIVVDDLAADRSPSLAVVLCHGYGAPAADLASLAESILSDPGIAREALLVFPAAPIDLTPNGLQGGRAWWHIDLDRLLNRPTPQLLQQFRQACPLGLRESREMLIALLAELETQFGLAPARTILGGFSQGAMLATDVALRLPRSPAALCVLSGALINETEWASLVAQRAGLKVLQTHGLYDSILPLPMATPLRDLLQNAGCEVDFVSFPGDHGIPEVAIERINRLIADVLTKAGDVRPA